VWSPLETWAERFHVDETGDRPRTPRVGRVLGRSRIVAWATHVVVFPAAQRVLMAAARLMDLPGRYSTLLAVGVGSVLSAVLGYGGWRFHALLSSRPLSPEAREIPLSLVLSFMRVSTGVVLAVLIAVPLAYLTFRSGRIRSIVLSVLQILGSVPATAFFPLIALLMLRLGLGMNVGSILLVLTGTFFYVMFNVLSGAASIPRELNEVAAALGIRGPRYVARVFLPAVLPSLVTGCVTAWGGGWNAIIFSEYMVAGGRRYEVKGIGAVLDRATYVTGDTQMIALSLMSMVALVVVVNRVFWDPVYQRVAARYKMEA
jgi:NitT/TauT family transport system permease protein